MPDFERHLPRGYATHSVTTRTRRTALFVVVDKVAVAVCEIRRNARQRGVIRFGGRAAHIKLRFLTSSNRDVFDACCVGVDTREVAGPTSVLYAAGAGALAAITAIVPWDTRTPTRRSINGVKHQSALLFTSSRGGFVVREYIKFGISRRLSASLADRSYSEYSISCCSY